MFDKVRIQRAIVSALLAGLIWGALQLQGEASRRLEVPVQFANLRDDLVVADPGAQKVSLTLRGVPARTARLDPEIIKIVLDLQGVEIGSSKFFIGEDKIVGLPAGISIEEITPYALNVRIDKKTDLEVPVEVPMQGQVADGFGLDAIQPSPAKVRFRGPEGLGRALDKVQTVKVDVTGLRASEVRRIQLNVDPKLLPYLEPTTVEAVIRIREQVIDKVVKGVRVDPLPPAGMRVKITPPQVDVIVKGPASKVQAVEAGAIEVVAEARSYGPGRHRSQKVQLTFKLNPPQEGVLFDYKPKEFDLQVTQ